MKTTCLMTWRNTKLFFRDKGMLLTSLVTPLILLLLYTTFLAEVFRDSVALAIPAGVTVDDNLIDGFVGGQLFSSLLAVSCVTVAFCANFLQIQDKVTGAWGDLTIAPVKPAAIAASYYIAGLFSTLLIALVGVAGCLVYIGIIGWYLSFVDILLIFLDVFLLSMFGTALSSCINLFLSTQGQMSAVGTIVSAGYGFICGAYMPISQFGEGLQKAMAFFPGTYGTSLLRNHALAGVFREMEAQSVPAPVIDGLRDSVDCNIYFPGMDSPVSVGVMYVVLFATVALLLGLFVLFAYLKTREKKK